MHAQPERLREARKVLMQVLTSLMLVPAEHSFGSGAPLGHFAAAAEQLLHILTHCPCAACALYALLSEPAHWHNSWQPFFTVAIIFAPSQSYLTCCCCSSSRPARWQQVTQQSQTRWHSTALSSQTATKNTLCIYMVAMDDRKLPTGRGAAASHAMCVAPQARVCTGQCHAEPGNAH